MGHSVRAGYMYAGMTDVAALTGEARLRSVALIFALMAAGAADRIVDARRLHRDVEPVVGRQLRVKRRCDHVALASGNDPPIGQRRQDIDAGPRRRDHRRGQSDARQGDPHQSREKRPRH